MNNYDNVLKYTTESVNSAGTAQKKFNEAYNEGIESKINTLTANFENLSKAFVSSGLIEGVVDTGSGMLGAITWLIKNLHTIPTLVAAAAGALSVISNKGFIKLKDNEDSVSGKSLTSGINLKKLINLEFHDDIPALKQFNEELKNGIPYSEAFNNNLLETSEVTKKLGAQMGQGEKNINQAVSSLNKMSIASKAASIGMKALSAAINMGIVLVVSLAIDAIVNGIDNLVHAQQKAIDAGKEASESINTINEEFKKNAEYVQDNVSQYAELSQGVGKFNKNISLSNEDYATFLEQNKALAEIFPDLVIGYDSQGNEILNLNGSVKDITDSLNEYLKVAKQTAQQKILDEFGKTLSGNTAQIQQYEKEIQKLEKERENLQNTANYKGVEIPITTQKDVNGNTTYVPKTTFDSENQAVFLRDELQKSGIQAELKKNPLKMEYQVEFAVDEKLLDYSISNSEQIINDKIAGLKDQINKTQKIQLSPAIQAYLDTSVVYGQFDKDSQSAISSIVTNLDFTGKSEEQAKAMIDGVVNTFNNDKTIAESVKKLFSLSDSELPYGEWKAQAEKLIDTITNALGLDGDSKKKLIISMGFDFDETDRMVKSIDDKMSKVSAGDLSKLSKQDIKIAYSIDNVGNLTFDELKNKIEETKNSAETPIDISVLKDGISEASKSISSLQDVLDEYNKQGYISTDTVNKAVDAYPQFVKYIQKVGDQYKINTSALADLTKAKKFQNAETDEYLKKLKEQELGTKEFAKTYNEFLDAVKKKYGKDKTVAALSNDLEKINNKFLDGKSSVNEYFNNLQKKIKNIDYESIEKGRDGAISEGMQSMFAGLTQSTVGGIEYISKQFKSGSITVTEFTKSIGKANDNLLKLYTTSNNLHQDDMGRWANEKGVVDDYANSLQSAQSELSGFNTFNNVIQSNIGYLQQFSDEFGNISISAISAADVTSSAFQRLSGGVADSLAALRLTNYDAWASVVTDVYAATGQSVNLQAVSNDQICSYLTSNAQATGVAVNGTMAALGKSINKMTQSAGKVISALGNVISNFKYTLSFTPRISGSLNPIDWFKSGLPSIAIDIDGSGGTNVQSLAGALTQFGNNFASVDFGAMVNLNSFKSSPKPSVATPTDLPKRSKSSSPKSGRSKSAPKSGRSKSGGSKSGGKDGQSSTQEVELYVAEIDKLAEAEERLAIIQDKREKLEKKLDLSDNSKNKIINLKKINSYLKQEQDSLNKLNTARKQMIWENISKLKGKGFDIDYNSYTNELLIKNMEQINNLYGKNNEESNQIRKSYEELIKKTQELNDANKDASSNWLDLAKSIRDNNEEVAELLLKPYDDLISKIEDFNLFNNLKLSKLDVFKYKLDEINRLLKEGCISLETYKELVRDTAKEMYDEKSDAINKVIDLTMDLIKKEKEDEVDALEQQKDKYSDIIELKKEALDLTKEENDYQKTLSEKLDEISKIQNQIDELKPDTSRESIAQQKQLNEELANLQNDLDDTQADHAYDAQQDSLDKQQEVFEDQKDEEIKKVEETIDTTQKLYDLAIQRIDTDWDNLYKDLIEYNDEYVDGIRGEDSLVSALQEAKKVMDEFGVSAKDVLGLVKEVYSGVSDGKYPSQVYTLIGQMQTNSKKWFSASDSEKIDLQNKNADIVKQIEDLINDSVYNSNGTWKIGSTGKNLYDIVDQDYSDIVRGSVQTMIRNGGEWKTADSARKAELESENQRIITEDIEPLIGEIYIDGNGNWIIKSTGEKLYDKYKYHTGGIAGNKPTLKQNEMMAILEKGEPVLDKKKEQGVYKLIDFASFISKKFNGAITKGFDASSMSTQQFTFNPSSKIIAPNQSSINTFSPQIEVNIEGATDKNDANKLGNTVSRRVLKELEDAFSQGRFGNKNPVFNT